MSDRARAHNTALERVAMSVIERTASFAPTELPSGGREMTCPSCAASLAIDAASDADLDIVPAAGGLVIYHLGQPVHSCELEAVRDEVTHDRRARSNQRTERVARAVAIMANQLNCDWQDAFVWMNARAEEAAQPVETIAVAILAGHLRGTQ